MASDHAPFGSGQAQRARKAGFLAILPIAIGVAPIGLIYGVSAADIDLSPALGMGMSAIIFAGAAQLATVQLLAQGAAAPVIVTTGLVINARLLMYAASLEPHFQPFPARWKAFGAYFLTDEAYAVAISRYGEDGDRRTKLWYYLAAAVTLWAVWNVVTVVGYVLGARVPESWSLDFAVPLVFLALLVPAVRDRSSLAAALAAGVLAVALAGLPLNLGLVSGALAGIAVGVTTERLRT
jgi:4-azaleucine resistance transporter AzlC